MKYGVIAAGEETTLRAASEILEIGGNAYDAAVGAVFTSMTSEYVLTGAGGGGALLACPVRSDPILFDFFADALPPQPRKELDFFDVAVDFGSAKQVFHIGRGSVAVPGCVAGLLHVHRRLGVLPLEAVLEPAITTARGGVTLNHAQAYLIQILEPILCHNASGQALFSPHGTRLKTGDRFSNPDFGNFLEHLIKDGADFFYRGDGAKAILDSLGTGGLLTSKALGLYRVVERVPLTSVFQGRTLHTNPVPAPSGTLITFLLQLFERSGSLQKLDPATLALAMKVTSTAREEHSGDLEKENQILQILDPSNFSVYLESFRSRSEKYIRDTDIPSYGSTTHISIIDKQGNAASVTTTNGEGCGTVVPGMGIMLNNMLGEEDLNPQGFHLWPRQRRLPTMIAPTVIVGSNGPELVLGSGGSNRIRSAIAQVILNVLVHGLDLETAVKTPRIHLEGGILHCEPGFALYEMTSFPQEISVHEWGEKNLFFGGVNAVSPREAVGDTRREGVGIVH